MSSPGGKGPRRREQHTHRPEHRAQRVGGAAGRSLWSGRRWGEVVSHAEEFALPTLGSWEPLKALSRDRAIAHFHGQPVAGGPAPLASLWEQPFP